MSAESRTGRSGAAALLAQAVLSAAYLAWAVFDPPAADSARDAFALVPAAVAAAAHSTLAALGPGIPGKTRRAWLLLAGGMLALSTADGHWYANREAVSGTSATTRVLYFSHYLLTAWGLFTFPSVTRRARVQRGLDVATVVIGGSMVVSYLIIGPLAAAAGADPGEAAVMVAYAVADLVLLLASSLLILKPLDPATRPAFRILVLGQFLAFGNDLLYSTRAIEGLYAGSGMVPKLQLIVYLLFAASAHWHRRLSLRPRDPASLPGAPGGVSLLPYGAIAAGLATLIFAAVREGSPAFSVLALLAVALSLVAAARQLLAIRLSAHLLAEREARRGEERARSAALREWQETFDAIRSPVLVLDAEQRVARLNRSAALLAGEPAESCAGRSLVDLGSAEPWAEAGRLASAARRAGSQSSRARDDASGRSWELAASAFGTGEAEARLAIVTIEDVTERLRAESERERLISDLAAKNAELERFGYAVSHDLKSPLITVRTYLDQLEANVSVGDLARFRADLERIVAATDKMRRLLDDLLELSRVGRVVNTPSEVPLRELVQEAVALVAGRLAAGAVEVEIAPELPVVRGDRARLLQVFQNLLDNAAKFMGGQPQPRIEVGVRRDSTRQVVFIRDNGIGIEPRLHEKVFGLFDKLDPSSEGTGLGLALVRRIVEAHGGEVWVDSAGGGMGASFCISLPRM